MAGRVEVYTSGQWITITESSTVGRTEADVICRQLGFPNSVYYGSVGDLGWVKNEPCNELIEKCTCVAIVICVSVLA